MTTEVQVKANHGWPVRVTLIQWGLDEEVKSEQEIVVSAGEVRSFHVHSNCDLYVHEIQPDEGQVAKVDVGDKMDAEVIRAKVDDIVEKEYADQKPRVVTGYIAPIHVSQVKGSADFGKD
jgi:hypothetical protein